MVIAAASTVVGPGTYMVKVRESSWKTVASRQRTGSPFELRVSIHIVRVALFGSQVPSEIQKVDEVESAHRRRNLPEAASQVTRACPWNGCPSIWLRKSPVTQSPCPPVVLISMPLRICGGSPGGPPTCMVASQVRTRRANRSVAAAGTPGAAVVAGPAAPEAGATARKTAAATSGGRSDRNAADFPPRRPDTGPFDIGLDLLCKS